MCFEAEMTEGQRLVAESRHMGVEVRAAADKLDRLEAENARLRDIVRDMCAVIVKADWTSAEDDEMASGCIDRAIEIGVDA